MSTQKPTVASLAARADEQDAKLDAILAALQGDAKAPATKGGGKAKVTTAKARQIRRNLDALEVECGEVTFTVAPASSGGTLYRRGARVQCPTGRSLTGDEVAALVSHSDEIEEAIATVDERALIGAFLPEGESA